MRVLQYVEEDDRFTPTAKVWLETRWAAEAVRRRHLEHLHRRLYWLVQVLSIGGAVALPTLITLGRTQPGARDAALWLSLVVALATVIERVFRFGPRWHLYRVGADQLGREGWAYLMELAPYDTSQDPPESPERRFRRFQVRVEELISDFNSGYVRYGIPVLPSAKPATGADEGVGASAKDPSGVSI